MTRCAVISDTHGATFRVEQFSKLALNESFDFVIHLGDGVDEARWLARNLPMPVKNVAGNCDYSPSTPNALLFDCEGVRIFAVHGHLYPSIRYDLTGLSYAAEENNANLALYGHTYRADVTWISRVLMVNPGALKDGRYAVVTIEDKTINPRLMEL